MTTATIPSIRALPSHASQVPSYDGTTPTSYELKEVPKPETEIRRQTLSLLERTGYHTGVINERAFNTTYQTIMQRIRLTTSSDEAREYRKIAEEISTTKGLTELAADLKRAADYVIATQSDRERCLLKHTPIRALTLKYIAEREEEVQQLKRMNRSYDRLDAIATECYTALHEAERTDVTLDKKVQARLESLAEQARYAQLHPPKKATGLFGRVKSFFKGLF